MLSQCRQVYEWAFVEPEGHHLSRPNACPHLGGHGSLGELFHIETEGRGAFATMKSRYSMKETGRQLFLSKRGAVYPRSDYCAYQNSSLRPHLMLKWWWEQLIAI